MLFLCLKTFALFITFCFCIVYVEFTYFAMPSEVHVYIIDQPKQITYTYSTYHHNKSDKPLI